MEGRIGPWLLWSRALVLGGLATGLGAIGHVTAGGALPGAATLTTLTVVMVALSAPLLLRPATAARLALSLAGGQLIVHVVLTAAAGHGGTTSMAGMSAGTMAGHAHAQPSGVPVDAVLAHLGGHAPMMAAHVAAAALLGLWLSSGEHALWTLIALAVRRLVAPRPALAVVDARTRRLTTPTPRPAGPRSLWETLPHPTRGPPLVAAS